MKVDVVIPAVRDPDRLLWSLGRQTRPPDMVTVVSNEEIHLPPGLPARILRFSSDAYCYGQSDVVLRRNIGLWWSEADIIVFQDQDQFAPAGMVEAAHDQVDLGSLGLVWGHHRFVDFDQIGNEALLNLPPEAGEAREDPPNAFHKFMSCYGGMMAGLRSALLDLQGYDMAFLGRQQNEDQNLGYRWLQRLGLDRAFIFEPPFAWHPLERGTSGVTTKTNSCGDHELVDSVLAGRPWVACRKCPYQHVAGDEELMWNEPILPFDPALVTVTAETA